MVVEERRQRRVQILADNDAGVVVEEPVHHDPVEAGEAPEGDRRALTEVGKGGGPFEGAIGLFQLGQDRRRGQRVFRRRLQFDQNSLP